MRRHAWALSLLVLLPACEKNELGPVSAPAAEHPSYAVEYPAKVESTSKRFQIEKAWAKDFGKASKEYHTTLKDPDWSMVEQIYELALADGKSAHYAEVRGSNAEVAEFFVQEKKELVQRVSGSVQYHADQKGCDTKFYGAVDRGLERGVKERFEERDEASSQANQFITEHEGELGKDNTTALRSQAKEIAAAAHLVYVALAERHGELTGLAKEGQQVEKTIERRLDELAGPPPKEETAQQKKAREEQLEALRDARSKLEAAERTAKKHVESSEEEVIEARETFETSFRALMDQVRGKK